MRLLLREGSCGDREAGNGPRAHQRLANCVARGIVHKLRTAEAHFDFCGMNVDVHFVVRHFQEQQRSGKNRVRMDVAISLVNGVQDQAVTNQPFVHKNINSIAIGALDFRP